MKLNLKNPIICALDLDDPKKALDIVNTLGDTVGAYKIGPRLFFKLKTLKDILKFAPVFMDFKFYDIPSTMEASINACYELEASIVTVHASCGDLTLKKLKKLESQKERPFHIACVTVLTSFDETLPANWKPVPAKEHVEILSKSIFKSGLNTVVCSPLEASHIRKKYPHANIITPGINLNKYADQARVADATYAIKAGADALVIGRAIINSPEPKQVTLNLLNSIDSNN